jgi:class 3 adenylate cyclase
VKFVDRFVEASHWSTARRTAVFALGVFLPIQLVQYFASRPALARLGLLDMRLFDLIFISLIGLSIVIGGASAFLASRGVPGDWTFYVYLGSYILVTAIGVYQFGVNSSAAFFPSLAPLLFIPIWFDVRKTLFALGLSQVCLIAIVAVTVANGTYAPGLLDRSVDAQGSLRALMAGIPILLLPLIAGLAFLMVVGAALRLERSRLAATRDQLSEAVALISKYVPAELASGILSGDEAPSTGYRRQKVTSFFSDIVGFTELAEEMEPEELAVVLNEYFTEMASIAERNHGTVDELQGDGLILVFGAPAFHSDREHALDAVRTASEMQAEIGALNERWRQAGIDVTIEVRIGINTGVVTVGHFGTGNRLKYTVLGKHVNLAARVQAICEPGEILISKGTWLLVKDDVAVHPLGAHEFKGIARPVEVYQLSRT